MRPRSPTSARCRCVRDLPVKHPNAEAYLQFARNTVKRDGAQLPGAAEVRRGGRQQPEDEVRRRHEGYEREIFMALMITPECRALRHLFVAERAASKIPDVPETRPCARSTSWP